ncbi:phage regulatory protein [Fusobacterium necrophorum]|uniref:phage regulatory protein n=1 Tax=Fusobacterium necrophorum TaxID=859 RepID=UPI0001BC58F0
MNLKVKNEMTSLELVEQINFFREKEGSKNKLLHKNLMAVIRDEFQEEINELKIQPVEYRDKKGEKRPMFILTLSQAKQVLVRESKYVRRAIIQYIEKLEQALRQPKQTKLDFQEKDVIRTTWKGEPVIELVQLARYINMTSDNLHFLTKHDKVTLRYQKLMEFRKENPRRYNQSVNAISILFKETVITICKKYGIYEKYKDFIENYFRVDNRIEDKTPKVPVVRENKEPFEDNYYNRMFECMKKAYIIESRIEKIYEEELLPLYNKIEELNRAKKDCLISPFNAMKYGSVLGKAKINK